MLLKYIYKGERKMKQKKISKIIALLLICGLLFSQLFMVSLAESQNTEGTSEWETGTTDSENNGESEAGVITSTNSDLQNLNQTEITPFIVGDTFNVNGINYNVLTEDGTTGTVSVGNNSSATINNLVIPAQVENGGDYLYCNWNCGFCF